MSYRRISRGLTHLGLALFITSIGQVRAQQHLLESLSLAEGLPQSQIWDIEQDRDGFMWYATYGGGVARFDGVRFQVFGKEHGLPSNTIFGIHVTQSGEIWMGTREGVARRIGDGFEVVGGIPPGVKVYDLVSDGDGTVWAATEAGIYRLELDSFIPARPVGDVSVTSIQRAPDGSIWFGTAGSGAYRLKDDIWTTYTMNSGLPHNTVLSLGTQRDGTVWVGTEHGVAQITDSTVVSFDTSDGLANNRVQAIYEDYTGVVWFGTDLGATRRIENRFEALEAQALQSLPVWSITGDHEGSVHIGTSGKGVFFFSHSPFTHLDGVSAFDGRTVWNMVKGPDGTFWFGLEGGLKRFDGDTMRQLPLDDAVFRSRSVRALAFDRDGSLWAGTSRGLWRQSGDRFVEVLSSSGDHVNDIRAIRMGPSEVLWVATLGGGAYRIDGSYVAHLGDSGNAELYDILETRDGELWTAGGNGVSITSGLGRRLLTTRNGLSHDEVVALYEDPTGNVWMGTYGGGLTVARHGQEGASIRTITSKDGLTDDTILFLRSDANDGLWIGTNRGLNRLDLEAFAKNRIQIRKYGRLEGFVGIEANLHAAFREPGGAMWFGHIDGVSKLASGGVSPIEHPPITKITGLRLFLETPDWSDRDISVSAGLPDVSGLQLPARDNHVTFDFVGLSYRAADRVSYQHRLVGFDSDWSPAHLERTATYSNLRPGDYGFEVRASVDGTNWSRQAADFDFKILRPYWQTWWFLVLMGLSAAATLTAIFDLRTRSLRRRQRRLEALVSDRTVELTEAREEALRAARVKGQFLANMSHEIRTPMNGVLGFASLLADSPLDAEQREYVDVIKSSGDALLGIINDILDFSRIEAEKAELVEAPFSPRMVAEQVGDLLAAGAAEKGVELVVSVDPTLPELFVGDAARLQQVLVNLTGNAIKFTNEGEVVLSLSEIVDGSGSSRIGFRVRDTGIGIPTDRLDALFAPFTQADASTTRKFGGTGLGLAISDRLVRLMGGRLKVESELEVGSSFHFELGLETSEDTEDRVGQAAVQNALAGRSAVLLHRNAAAARATTAQLRFWGIDVVGVDSETAMWAALEAEGAPDVLCLDARSTEAHWTQTVRDLAAKHPGLEVLVLRDVGVRSAAMGDVATVSKPCRRNALFESLLEVGSSAGVFRRDSAHSSPGEAGLRVLVAEDHPTNRRLVQRLLDKSGCTSRVVADGLQAVEAVRAHPFDVVLLDIHMPVMDGLEAARLINEELAVSDRPKLVAVTASVLAEDRLRCREAGFDDFLAKPLQATALEALLTEVAQERAAQDRGGETSPAKPSVEDAALRRTDRQASTRQSHTSAGTQAESSST